MGAAAMGAAAISPAGWLETGCMGDRSCCQCERLEDNEFLACAGAGSYSTGDEKPLKVRALPALGEDNEFAEANSEGYPGFPTVFKDHWGVCDGNECVGDKVCWAHKANDDNQEINEQVFDSGTGVNPVRSLPALSEDAHDSESPDPFPRIYDGVPLSEGVESLSPELVDDLLRTHKCIAIDVRGADRASGLIEGARHIPAISMNSPFVARLPDLVRDWKNERLVIFFCQFCKHRAPYCANLYRQQADSMQRVAVLEGGFRAWQSTGLTVRDGGGTASERATADAWALHQGALVTRQGSPIKSRHLGGG